MASQKLPKIGSQAAHDRDRLQHEAKQQQALLKKQREAEKRSLSTNFGPFVTQHGGSLDDYTIDIDSDKTKSVYGNLVRLCKINKTHLAPDSEYIRLADITLRRCAQQGCNFTYCDDNKFLTHFKASHPDIYELAVQLKEQQVRTCHAAMVQHT
jgi:hypothetical protein